MPARLQGDILPYVKSHRSLFYSHDLNFVGDCFIAVADWSIPHHENKKVTRDFLHTGFVE